MQKPTFFNRNTLRESLTFTAVGGVQYVVDVAIFGLLMLCTGWAIPSNIASRASGAVCGYYLNGVFTFRALGREREGFGLRFIAAWLLMTAVSTVVVRLITGLEQVSQQALLVLCAKAAVELVLFVVGFLLCKLWIFKPRSRPAVGSPVACDDAQSKPATLFIFAHADDEYFCSPWIKRMVEEGRPVFAVYTTDGAGGGADSVKRQHESCQALARLGVPADNLLFIGVEHGFPDGRGHEHMDATLAAVREATRSLTIDVIHLPAWEGGHADHDAAHLIGVALARELGVDRVFECPGYNASSSILPFRVMTWPRQPSEPDTLRFGIAQGLFHFALCECHASQWRTWLGLGPESFVRFVLLRRVQRRLVGAIDYTIPPHAGRLLYEKRFGVPFAEFRANTESFISRHVASAGAVSLTPIGGQV